MIRQTLTGLALIASLTAPQARAYTPPETQQYEFVGPPQVDDFVGPLPVEKERKKEPDLRPGYEAMDPQRRAEGLKETSSLIEDLNRKLGYKGTTVPSVKKVATGILKTVSRLSQGGGLVPICGLVKNLREFSKTANYTEFMGEAFPYARWIFDDIDYLYRTGKKFGHKDTQKLGDLYVTFSDISLKEDVETSKQKARLYREGVQALGKLQRASPGEPCITYQLDDLKAASTIERMGNGNNKN